MKKFTIYFWAFICLVTITLAGCKADVNLNDIDMTVGVKTGLSLPIGSMKVKFGDFIGDTTIQNITIDEQGRYAYVDTFYFAEDYHKINLEDYASQVSKTFNIHQQLTEQHPALASAGVIPANTAFSLDFPFSLKLNSVNDDLKNRRIDSMIVSAAQFTTTLSLQNIELTWKEIKKIELILSDDFRREQGKKLTIPTTNYGFNREIPVYIDDFNLILMEDINAAPSYDNVKDSISMTMRFHIQTNQPLNVESGDKIKYLFKMDFWEYKAMFGFFDPSNKMHDSANDYLLAEGWPMWNTLSDLMLPAREPSVFVEIEHALAMPLVLNVNKLNVLASDSVTRKEATFNGNNSTSIHFPNIISVTDPLETRIKDTVIFDYTDERGNLDELLTVHPIRASYDYDVIADTTTEMRQFRITENTAIDVKAMVNVPLDFDSTVMLSYSDTIENITISEFSLRDLLTTKDTTNNTDSIQSDLPLDSLITINDAHLQLVLTIENWIPFQINGSFQFLDANDNIVMLKADEDLLSSQGGGLDTVMTKSYDLALNYPTEIIDGEVTAPAKSQLILTFSPNDFKRISTINKIVFTASLGKNIVPVKLTPRAALRVYVGITADVDAILDMNQLLKNKQEDEYNETI